MSCSEFPDNSIFIYEKKNFLFLLYLNYWMYLLRNFFIFAIIVLYNTLCKDFYIERNSDGDNR